MPRRSTTRASNLLSAPNAFPPPPQNDPNSDDLVLLRRQWRWAAFSQFFTTFSQLFAMDDVTVADIEKDLVHQSSNVIPRIMQRMLYSLSYDRKVSVDNWQNALRKQYIKRDPQANPLGVEVPDANRPAKHEEEPTPLENEPATANSVTNDEADVERAPSTSHEASEPMESVVENPSVSAQQSDTRSRQSSVVDNRAASMAKDAETGDESEPQKPVNWFDLPLLVKLETMHTLVEWQFQNPTRLRTIMKSDDETASWRIEPIGYDSKLNAYWFIGGDRLWIQRVPPKAPRPKALKRKRGSEKSQEKKPDPKPSATPAKRARLNVAPPTPSTPSGRHSRAAKDQAKLKLDEQARELAELNRQANTRSTRATRQTITRAASSKTASSSAPPRPLGTRASARLRGSQEDQEWQPIPEEWLNEGKGSKRQNSKSIAPRTGLESDEESGSDLTELSDDGGDGVEASEPVVPNGKSKNGGSRANGTEQKAVESPAEQESEVPQGPLENFVEWETICATLYEWEHIAERFEKATHYTEKALYKVLVNDIVPFVTQELKEIERRRELEEAMTHRKKSSRLAIRESQLEEARLAAKLKQEEEEKMSRARRLEARQQKEEAERLKREKAREQRRQEREAREASRKAQTAGSQDARSESELPTEATPDPPKARARNASGQEKRAPKANGKSKMQSGSRTPAGEDWELACEVCQGRGINVDDGTPMMSCGRCGKWQHIQCHDRADKAAGRPPRNWDAVEFVCKSCRAAQFDGRREYYPPANQHPSVAQMHNGPQLQPYRSYHQPITFNNSSDVRSSHYMPYRDTAQQSYYVRQPSGQQLPAQGSYQTSPSYPSSSHPQDAAVPQTISFSHYQPAAHGFSTSAHKTQPDPRYTYDHSNHHHQPYHNSTHQYNHTQYPQQQYRSDVPSSYKPPPSAPAWNVSTTTHTAGYPAAYNGSTGLPNSSGYRGPSAEGQDTLRHTEPSHTSFARYPEQHYQSTQFKHHPTSSYQPPLGR